jgi:hypothetical protein
MRNEIRIIHKLHFEICYKMDSVNQKIIKLWKDHRLHNRAPLLYPELKKDSLLFVGLNPSFSEQGLKRMLKEELGFSVISENLDSFFDFENFDDSKIEIFQQINKISKEKYAYFKKFREISSKTHLDWEHIDLFYVRETNQKAIEREINSSFYQNQINITLELIEFLNPKMIVIENAFASKILKEKLNLTWNDKIGTYSSQKKVPVFLSGMLTGQRALDIGSFDRLVWHLKLVKGYSS